MMFRTQTLALAATVAILATGCVVPPQLVATQQQPADPTPVAAKPAAKPREQLATMETYQYLRVDPEKTGVLNAADDGRYTYLAFAAKVDETIEFFDADGAPLTAARAGAVVALPGIHKGILVRQGRANTFVAPNPRAAPNDRPNIEADPDVIEARTRLEVATTQLPAFRRAIERADAAKSATAATTPASPATPPKPIAAAPRPDDPSYVRTPEGVMVRVFFATGGRTIVRPDDGLQRLETEATGAQEIRIAGYTDNIGPDTVNAKLAQSRAEAIRTLMLKRGVPPERIVVTWSAGGRDIADNTTETGRAMNRRVEVLFVKAAKTAASTQ
jgi:outer membrane protein OmpA-like peptidoglycan-associated protein